MWWERYMGNPKQQKEAEDTRQAFDVSGMKCKLLVKCLDAREKDT